MSGETEKDVSGLTVDTLRLLMNTEIRRIDDRFGAFLEVYRRDQEKSNEFRAALDDLGKQMATRRELEGAVESSNQRFEGLSTQTAELRSRLDVGPAALGQVQAYQQEQIGRQAGIGVVVAVIVGAVTVTAALVGILAFLANHAH